MATCMQTERHWLDVQAATETEPCLPIAVDPLCWRLQREGTRQTQFHACRPCHRHDCFRPCGSTSKQTDCLMSRRHGSGWNRAVGSRNALVQGIAAARAPGIALPCLTLPYALFPVLQARSSRSNSGVARTAPPPATSVRFGCIGCKR